MNIKLGYTKYLQLGLIKIKIIECRKLIFFDIQSLIKTQMDALSTRDFKKVPLNGSETQGLSSLSTEREKKFVLRRSSKSLTSLITTGEKSE